MYKILFKGFVLPVALIMMKFWPLYILVVKLFVFDYTTRPLSCFWCISQTGQHELSCLHILLSPWHTYLTFDLLHSCGYDQRISGSTVLCHSCTLRTKFVAVWVNRHCMPLCLIPVYTAQTYRFVPYVYRAGNCAHERLYDNMCITEP